jgi:hypothetical protein
VQPATPIVTTAATTTNNDQGRRVSAETDGIVGPPSFDTGASSSHKVDQGLHHSRQRLANRPAALHGRAGHAGAELLLWRNRAIYLTATLTLDLFDVVAVPMAVRPCTVDVLIRGLPAVMSALATV